MRFLSVIAIILASFSILSAEDYSFEIPEEDAEEEEKLTWSGYLDGRYFAFHTDQSSPFYQLQFFDRGSPGYLSQYKLELYLDADYQTKDIGLLLKTHSTYYNDSESRFDLFEAYGNVNLSLSSFIQMGKKMYNWGKGYAFNSVGYVNPFKDPENPELAQAGLLSLNFEKIKSFDSDILKTVALSAITVPPFESLSNRYGEIRNTDLAAKIYFLLWDMDMDIMGFYSRTGPSSVGGDFAANFKENIEFHGELSYSMDSTKNTIVDDDIFTTKEDTYSYLLGLRYLSQWRTTIIAEYYYNGAGLTEAEYADYLSFIQNSVGKANVNDVQDADGLPENPVKRALEYNRTYFKSSNLMQYYLYLKIVQPEPFNWLYFTPSLFTIYNLMDNSLLLAAPLSYKPFSNFEFVFWPTFLVGDGDTEFGGRQFQQKYELRIKVYY